MSARDALPALRRKDLVAFAGLPLQLLVADRVPQAAWPRLARLSALLRAHRQPRWRAREAAHIAAYLGRPADDPAMAAVLVETLTELRLAAWRGLAARRAGGWQPVVDVGGAEHLDAALARGRGAIVWLGPFHHASLGAKVALFGLGHPAVQLSRTNHGGEVTSRWGARHVSPFFTAGEQRFLAGRALIPAEGSTTAAVRRLLRCLAGNRVVSIAAFPRGDRQIEVPFLGGRLRVAAGAPALARRSGAALLPISVLRRADGACEVAIGPRLNPPGGMEDETALTAAFAAWLELLARRAPGQVRWRGGVTPGPSPG